MSFFSWIYQKICNSSKKIIMKKRNIQRTYEQTKRKHIRFYKNINCCMKYFEKKIRHLNMTFFCYLPLSVFFSIAMRTIWMSHQITYEYICAYEQLKSSSKKGREQKSIAKQRIFKIENNYDVFWVFGIVCTHTRTANTHIYRSMLA